MWSGASGAVGLRHPSVTLAGGAALAVCPDFIEDTRQSGDPPKSAAPDRPAAGMVLAPGFRPPPERRERSRLPRPEDTRPSILGGRIGVPAFLGATEGGLFDSAQACLAQE
jgi:hypothetical protein